MKSELGISESLSELGSRHMRANMANLISDQEVIISILESEEKKYHSMLRRGNPLSAQRWHTLRREQDQLMTISYSDWLREESNLAWPNNSQICRLEKPQHQSRFFRRDGGQKCRKDKTCGDPEENRLEQHLFAAQTYRATFRQRPIITPIQCQGHTLRIRQRSSRLL